MGTGRLTLEKFIDNPLFQIDWKKSDHSLYIDSELQKEIHNTFELFDLFLQLITMKDKEEKLISNKKMDDHDPNLMFNENYDIKHLQKDDKKSPDRR